MYIEISLDMLAALYGCDSYCALHWQVWLLDPISPGFLVIFWGLPLCDNYVKILHLWIRCPLSIWSWRFPSNTIELDIYEGCYSKFGWKGWDTLLVIDCCNFLAGLTVSIPGFELFPLWGLVARGGFCPSCLPSFLDPLDLCDSGVLWDTLLSRVTMEAIDILLRLYLYHIISYVSDCPPFFFSLTKYCNYDDVYWHCLFDIASLFTSWGSSALRNASTLGF